MSKIIFRTRTGEKEFDAGELFANKYAARCLHTLGVPVELRNESGSPVPVAFKPVESDGDYEVHIGLPSKPVLLNLDRPWHVQVAFRVFGEAAGLPVYWRMKGEKGAREAAHLDKWKKFVEENIVKDLGPVAVDPSIIDVSELPSIENENETIGQMANRIAVECERTSDAAKV